MSEPASIELITQIKRLAALLQQNMDARLKQYGLARTQYQMMQQLDAEPWISTAELAERMQIEPATLSGIADALQAKGLVKRIGHITDRRRKDIRLTIKGIGLLLSIPSPAPEIESIMIQGVTHDIEKIRAAVSQMVVNLQKELKNQEKGKAAKQK